MSNPVPYVAVFFVLFLVFLGVLTWAIGLYVKYSRCATEPSIWCRDDWQCNTACPQNSNVLSCYKQKTNIASCIYKYITDELKPCYNPQPDNNDPNQVLCTCPTTTETNTLSCLSGCASNVNDLPPQARAQCCCTGPGCGGVNNSNPNCFQNNTNN